MYEVGARSGRGRPHRLGGRPVPPRRRACATATSRRSGSDGPAPPAGHPGAARAGATRPEPGGRCSTSTTSPRVISLTPHGGAHRRDVVAAFGAAAPDGVPAGSTSSGSSTQWVPGRPRRGGGAAAAPRGPWCRRTTSCARSGPRPLASGRPRGVAGRGPGHRRLPRALGARPLAARRWAPTATRRPGVAAGDPPRRSSFAPARHLDERPRPARAPPSPPRSSSTSDADSAARGRGSSAASRAPAPRGTRSRQGECVVRRRQRDLADLLVAGRGRVLGPARRGRRRRRGGGAGGRVPTDVEGRMRPQRSDRCG